MLDPSHYPWVFRRDEVDLLEDQIEDLFHRHQKKKGEEMTMEQEVLNEQLQTEEAADAALSQKFGESLFGSIHVHTKSMNDDVFPMPVDALLKQTQKHPLYVQTREWAQLVFGYAKDRYELDGVRSRELFRVYVNVNLIPIKLSAALSEEMHEDEFALEIADQEYGLAITYLQRVIACLDHLEHTEIDNRGIQKMSRIGQRIMGVVEAKRSELQRRRSRGQSRSV